MTALLEAAIEAAWEDRANVTPASDAVREVVESGLGWGGGWAATSVRVHVCACVCMCLYVCVDFVWAW